MDVLSEDDTLEINLETLRVRLVQSGDGLRVRTLALDVDRETEDANDVEVAINEPVLLNSADVGGDVVAAPAAAIVAVGGDEEEFESK
jgi:hypothetical protein